MLANNGLKVALLFANTKRPRVPACTERKFQRSSIKNERPVDNGLPGTFELQQSGVSALLQLAQNATLIFQN